NKNSCFPDNVLHQFPLFLAVFLNSLLQLFLSVLISCSLYKVM
ncbi:hypothetical protein J830_4318, partial [Acinetobacter baumannii 25691_7]